METNQSAFEEAADAHAVPAVVVSVTDYISRKHEEEVHSHGYVSKRHLASMTAISHEQMITDHQHGGHAAQSVKDFITRL